ncbi:retrovirus-related pol polyprotein from transposon TNT 1-94 [Tanacetum coccineum]
MLNKDNYIPWSYRLLRYEKSKPNRKLIYNSIMHRPYVRRMILEPGDLDHEVPITETFNEHTDEELTKKEVKQIKADDQAIHTILMGLPEDIYAAVDSCETAQEIWLRVQQMMKAKAFKLNYSTPTNNNQTISSNPCNKKIAQPGMNIGKDRQMQMVRAQNVGKKVVSYAVQNPSVQNVGNPNRLIVILGIANLNANQNGNGNVVAARAEGDLDEIKEVNANCILMANLQQASTSGTQTDKAPVYDSDGSAEVHHNENCYDNDIFNMFTQKEQYTELLEPIFKPHKVQQNNSNVISVMSSVEQSGGTVEQNLANVKEQHTATIKRLQAQLGDLKGNSKDTPCVSDTLDPLSQILEDENNTSKGTSGNTKLAKQTIMGNQPSFSGTKLYSVTPFPNSKVIPKVGETNALSKPVTSNSAPSTRESEVIKIGLWCADSGCSKHMIGNLKLLINFVWKFLRTVRFGNDHVATILGYGDLQWGNILTTSVYFIEGFGHNLLSVGRFCDSDLEVAFRRNTCFVRNLEGVDLLKGNHTTKLYIINIHEMASTSPICLMARATSTKSKDEAPKVIKTFLKKIQVLLQAPVIIVKTDNDTEFKNQVLKEYFDNVGISHQSSSMRTPQQNGNDHEDIEKLGAKGDIGFFISYSANSCAYRVYNQRTKKIIETINVTFDELSAIAFEQHNSKLRLQSMTSRQISSRLDLTYAPSTITSQKPTEHELDLLFEVMYDDYIGGQPSTATRTAPAAQAPQVVQTPTTSTTTADTTPKPTNSSSQTANIPNTSQDVNELESPQQHDQQQDNQALLQPEIADNVPNTMFDGHVFENPFTPPSTSAAESSSSQYVDPSNMHTLYQPYPHKYQWTMDHPLEQVIGEPSRPVLIRNQLRTNGDMCIYALTVSTIEPRNVKEPMIDLA